MRAAVEKLRQHGRYEPIRPIMQPRWRSEFPALVVDEEAEPVKAIRRRFDEQQAFLFGERRPFKLAFCERCDASAQIFGPLVLNLNLASMVKEDPELVDLAIAHGFAHYLIELYWQEYGAKTPGGNDSQYFDPNIARPSDQQVRYTRAELMMRDANYHGEVDVFAAAVLVMMGKPVPDFAPVVARYRRNVPFPSPHIFAEQGVRVNTLRWIRENWR